jgi:hypothetical protein
VDVSESGKRQSGPRLSDGLVETGVLRFVPYRPPVIPERKSETQAGNRLEPKTETGPTSQLECMRTKTEEATPRRVEEPGKPPAGQERLKAAEQPASSERPTAAARPWGEKRPGSSEQPAAAEQHVAAEQPGPRWRKRNRQAPPFISFVLNKGRREE